MPTHSFTTCPQDTYAMYNFHSNLDASIISQSSRLAAHAWPFLPKGLIAADGSALGYFTAKYNAKAQTESSAPLPLLLRNFAARKRADEDSAGDGRADCAQCISARLALQPLCCIHSLATDRQTRPSLLCSCYETAVSAMCPMTSGKNSCMPCFPLSVA